MQRNERRLWRGARAAAARALAGRAPGRQRQQRSEFLTKQRAQEACERDGRAWFSVSIWAPAIALRARAQCMRARLSAVSMDRVAAAVLVLLACECAQCKRRVGRLANVPIGATGS